MRVLGINKGSTLSGKLLRQGGAAIYCDGRFVALPEERSSGVKYAGGFSTSLEHVLKAFDLPPDAEFDAIAVSTCCESEGSAKVGHFFEGRGELVSVGHHLSHAALAFYGSRFSSALVAILDGGGNTLDSYDPSICPEWWSKPREQATYYMATSTGLEVVDRDFEQPYDVGLGELFRAATYFLGWHSSLHASKTMALAGHGRRNVIGGSAFEMNDGSLRCPLVNRPADPFGMIEDLGDILGVDLGEPRTPRSAILQIHRDVASFVQRSIESALREKLTYLRRVTGATRLCLGGGIALNVVANGKLLDLFPDGVYVASAPGDDGQSLGNVMSVVGSQRNSEKSGDRVRSSDAELGPTRKIDSKSIVEGLEAADAASYVVFETTEYSFAALVARFLTSGSIVCLYRARSEFGPRALGARSILADPRRSDVASELNTLKAREFFMPFAPVVLKSQMHRYFAQNCDSPFMSFAVQAQPDVAERYPAVVNSDGTSRVQTAEPGDGSLVAEVLQEFFNATDVPLLLNTSFNLGGEPIVETIEEAIRAFSRMPINVLGVGRFVVVKNISPIVEDLPLEGSVEDLRLTVRRGRESTSVEPSGRRFSVATVIRQLQLLTNSVVFVRTELPLYDEYLEWLRAGRKVTTIRFRQDAVEIPFSSELPLFETPDYGPGDRSKPTEHVKVQAIRYQRFGELDAEDAVRDGFESLSHMRTHLSRIYPRLTPDSWVSVYTISLV